MTCGRGQTLSGSHGSSGTGFTRQIMRMNGEVVARQHLLAVRGIARPAKTLRSSLVILRAAT